MELKPEEITKIIRSQIKNYENKIEVSETGVVILVGDGIAKASGLEKCMAGELVEFPDGSYGMAQNLAGNPFRRCTVFFSSWHAHFIACFPGESIPWTVIQFGSFGFHPPLTLQRTFFLHFGVS